MIAVALTAVLAVMPVQTSAQTWLKCDWTATRNTLIAGKLGPDKNSQQSRIYHFDPNTDRLSIYDPQTLTLDDVSGVLVTDDVVWAQTIHNITAPNGVHSEIFKSIKIDRRTLTYFQFDSIQPLAYAPSTSVSTTGIGQCVKIAPQALTPAQF